VAQHGDLQVPIIDAQADEHAEKPAQDPIQEEREHEAQSDRLPGPQQRRMSTGADRICLPHRVTRRQFLEGVGIGLTASYAIREGEMGTAITTWITTTTSDEDEEDKPVRRPKKVLVFCRHQVERAH